MYKRQEYAETWVRDGGTRSGTAEFDRLYDAWLDDFERRGVRSVGFGYVLLRRPGGSRNSGLARVERLHGPLGSGGGGADGDGRGPGAALGTHLAACLAAHDRQAAASDEELAATSLTVAGDVTVERHYWPGNEDPTVMLLRQGGGFGRVVTVDTGLAAFVGACDGELTAGAIIAAIAQLLEVDEVALAAELLAAARALIDDGMLRLPVE